MSGTLAPLTEQEQEIEDAYDRGWKDACMRETPRAEVKYGRMCDHCHSVRTIIDDGHLFCYQCGAVTKTIKE